MIKKHRLPGRPGLISDSTQSFNEWLSREDVLDEKEIFHALDYKHLFNRDLSREDLFNDIVIDNSKYKGVFVNTEIIDDSILEKDYSAMICGKINEKEKK